MAGLQLLETFLSCSQEIRTPEIPRRELRCDENAAPTFPDRFPHDLFSSVGFGSIKEGGSLIVGFPERSNAACIPPSPQADLGQPDNRVP